jgi:hypothetical protein
MDVDQHSEDIHVARVGRQLLLTPNVTVKPFSLLRRNVSLYKDWQADAQQELTDLSTIR